jgi:hypothetical protein
MFVLTHAAAVILTFVQAQRRHIEELPPGILRPHPREHAGLAFIL